MPGPTIGVTGAKRASRTNVGSTPPSFPKMKLGRKITYSSPDSLTARSISHLAAKYGTASFVRSSRPRALASTKRRTSACFAAAATFRVPCAITRSKSLSDPLMIATRWTTASTPSTAAASDAASVTSPCTSSAPHAAGLCAVPQVADEHAHRQVPRAQRVHDVRADEAGAARDEDHSPASKFLK